MLAISMLSVPFHPVISIPEPFFKMTAMLEPVHNMAATPEPPANMALRQSFQLSLSQYQSPQPFWTPESPNIVGVTPEQSAIMDTTSLFRVVVNYVLEAIKASSRRLRLQV